MRAGMAVVLTACWATLGCSGSPSGRPSDAGVPAAVQEIQSRAASCARAGAPCAEVLIRWETLPASATAEPAQIWLAEALARDPLTGGVAASPEAVARSFLAAFDTEAATQPRVQDWFLQRRARIVHQDSRVLSLVVDENLYTGGAHPLSTRRLVSFDRRGGEPVTLEQALRPGSEALFGDLLVRALRRALALPQDMALADAGLFVEDDQLPWPANFAVTGEGWLLHYDPYEIGPYALGPIELRLPFREIENIVQTDSAAASGSAPLVADPD